MLQPKPLINPQKLSAANLVANVFIQIFAELIGLDITVFTVYISFSLVLGLLTAEKLAKYEIIIGIINKEILNITPVPLFLNFLFGSIIGNKRSGKYPNLQSPSANPSHAKITKFLAINLSSSK